MEQKTVGFDQLKHFDSVTLMNDTCFGPLWDPRGNLYHSGFENDTEVISGEWPITGKTRILWAYSRVIILVLKKQSADIRIISEFYFESVQDFTNVQDDW